MIQNSISASSWTYADHCKEDKAGLDDYEILERLNIFSSGPTPQVTGHDAVDYGAYTGGYGAFGWYSDHPNHDGIGHRRR